MRFATASAPQDHIGQMLRAMEMSGELSIPALRALSPLPDKAQVLFDKSVVSVGLQRLTFVADLYTEGLTFPITDPLSVTEVEWDQVSQTGGAIRVMNPSARGENQMPDRVHKRVPVYLTIDDFSLGKRTLSASQRVGTPLDTSLASSATRRVNESIEDAAINGSTSTDGSALVIDGYSCPGLINAPNANTQNITDADWVTTPVGATILAETLAMIAKLQADKKFGPYNLYVSTVVGNNLNSDFKANGDLTIKQRLEQIEAGGRNLRVRVADMMPSGTVALVQMTEDVVQIIDGQAPTVIPWMSPDGWTLFWMVLAIQVPRIRSDYDGNSGICIGT